MMEGLRRDGKIVERDKDGTIVRSWTTFAEYHKDFQRNQEMNEVNS
jgi:hypothetical protein